MADTCSVGKRDAQAVGALVGIAATFFVAVATGRPFGALLATIGALAGAIIAGLVIDRRPQPGEIAPVPSDPTPHERSTRDSAPSAPPPARGSVPRAPLGDAESKRPQRKLLRRYLDVALRVVGIIAVLGGVAWGGVAAYGAIKPDPEVRVVERVVVADRICMDGTLEPGRSAPNQCFGHGGEAGWVRKATDRLEGRAAILWSEQPDHNKYGDITEFGP